MNNVSIVLVLVFSVTSASLYGDSGNRIDDMAAILNNDAGVQESVRLRRTIARGAFTHKSNQQSSFVRRKFHQKLSTSPEGRVSMATKLRHEKGSMAKATNKAGDSGNRIDDMAAILNNDAGVQESVRLRRTIARGAFTHKSNQQSSFVRRKFHQKLSTSPEGRVSMATKLRHEKGSMAKATNKAGYFAYNTYP